MADEVEADVWGRVAAKMENTQQRGAYALAGGEIVRAFISDLRRVVDGREVRLDVRRSWASCTLQVDRSTGWRVEFCRMKPHGELAGKKESHHAFG